MARENVMSTPIFDQLLREMAQRAEPRASATAPAASPSSPAPSSSVTAPTPSAETPDAPPTPRRRHRAD